MKMEAAGTRGFQRRPRQILPNARRPVKPVEESHVGDPFDRERSLCQRPDREPQQRQRVVVARRAIQPELPTPSASMDQHPLAVSPDADRDGLHERAAIGVSVAGAVVVEMAAPQTIWAVIPVCGAEGLDGDIKAAVSAAERIRAAAAFAVALVA